MTDRCSHLGHEATGKPHWESVSTGIEHLPNHLSGSPLLGPTSGLSLENIHDDISNRSIGYQIMVHTDIHKDRTIRYVQSLLRPLQQKVKWSTNTSIFKSGMMSILLCVDIASG